MREPSTSTSFSVVPNSAHGKSTEKRSRSPSKLNCPVEIKLLRQGRAWKTMNEAHRKEGKAEGSQAERQKNEASEQPK